MRTLTLVALLAAAGAAWADTTDATVKVYSLQVKERIQTLELIDVTAEKQPSDEAEPLTPALMAILEEAEALEITVEE